MNECLQLACACVQKSRFSEGGRSGRLGPASPDREFAQKHTRGQHSFKRNCFPQGEQALGRDPHQSSPWLLIVELVYQRVIFWVCSCVCLQAVLHVAEQSPLLERIPCSEGCEALQAEIVTCHESQSKPWLNGSSQDSEQGGESKGAPSWSLLRTVTQLVLCSDHRYLSCGLFPALHLHISST